MSKPCPRLLLTTYMCAAEVTQYNCFISFICLCFFLNFMHYISFLIWRSSPLLVFHATFSLLDVV